MTVWYWYFIRFVIITLAGFLLFSLNLAAVAQDDEELVHDSCPQWSPDGLQIAFTSNRAGKNDVWVVNADGSQPINLTTSLSFDNTSCPQWSPHGELISFSPYRYGSPPKDIYTVSIVDMEITNLTNGHISSASNPIWSPDGTYILLRTYLKIKLEGA